MVRAKGFKTNSLAIDQYEILHSQGGIVCQKNPPLNFSEFSRFFDEMRLNSAGALADPLNIRI